MNRFATAGAAFVFLSLTPALAADFPDSAGAGYGDGSYPQSFNWSGLYLGAHLGRAFGDFDSESGAASLSTEANSLVGGLYTGYNFQATPRILLGAEADFSLANFEGARTNGGVNLHSSSGWNSNIRARIGYSFDRVLVYGSAGLALADLELSAAGDTDRKTAFGWTLGAGSEVGITNKITARFEYVYQDFGEEDFNLNGTGVSSEFSDSTFRFGVGYKF